MQILNKNTWNRKEHFEFFSKMEEPYFGLSLDLDVQKAFTACKKEQRSFFLYYHYLSTRAANTIEAFKYRIQQEDIIIHDTIHVNTILIRPDTTFRFVYLPYHPTFAAFEVAALPIMQQVNHTTGIGLEPDTNRPDTIHYSAIPWIHFKGLSHARSYSYPDSVPKISFGKVVDGRMPLSIHVHHALMDAYHVGLYCACFQDLLNGELLG